MDLGNIIWLAATGAASIWGYVQTRRFMRHRLRYVDSAQKPTAPVIAGVAAAVVAAPVVWLLPIVGASTALYSIYESLLLRTLPVRDPAALVLLGASRGNTSWTNLQWEQIRDRASLFGGVLAWSSARFNTAARGQADTA